MRTPDVDKERSERSLSFGDFMKSYNEHLPSQFPRATLALLREFRMANASLFKPGGAWSLDQHRKKVMDWLTTKRVS